MKFHFKTAASTTRQKHLPASGTHKGEIHVWTHVIHYDDPFLRQAPYLLSQEEMARAARYHFEKDRRVYESSHVFIRKVLSHYTGLEAANIQLSPIVNQKPLMLNAPFPIHFNITHSGSKIMVAVGFDSDVGIDAERVIPDFDTDGFAEANYHPNELTELQSLKGEEETFFFYAVWTRKEAWLKLTGEGVNDKLRELDFSSKEAHPKVAPHGHKQVFMFTWKEGEDYIATLASDVDRNHTLFFSSQLLLSEAREDLNEAVEFGED